MLEIGALPTDCRSGRWAIEVSRPYQVKSRNVVLTVTDRGLASPHPMKLRLVVFVLLSLIGMFVTPGLRAQEGSIRQAMSPEEFHKAGLDKLSPEELNSLDRWLQGDREKTAKKAAARTAKTKMDLIVSRVDGTFSGLGGGTVIQLEDGTAWKQANSDDHFRGTSVDHPGAAVQHGVFGYKMRIEGVPEFYVDPVRK